jgi:hypothetical protein
MDNVQNCDSYINISSLQTYRSEVHDEKRKKVIYGSSELLSTVSKTLKVKFKKVEN